MGCSTSKPQRRRRRRTRKNPRSTLEPVLEVEDLTVPVYQADVSEFEGEGHTYRSEVYGQERDATYNHNVQHKIKFKQATYNGIHNIKVLHEDQTECRVRGAEFLPNGNLLLCDQANHKLKLFNQNFKYLSHYNLPGRPHEVCVHSSDKEGSDVYVTIPANRTVLEFYIEDRVFTPSETFQTDGWCYAIAPYKTGLVVSVGTKIEFMDTDGNLFKTLQYDTKGDSMFESPFHIVVTPDNNLLISDILRKCVVCMTVDGDTIFRYDNFTTPHGLIVDSEGYIYLCGANNETVDVLHQISKGGDKIKSLLSWRHVGFKPDAICFREKDQILVICGENDRFKTFELQTVRTGKIYSNDAIMGEPFIEDLTVIGRTTPEVQQEMKMILRT